MEERKEIFLKKDAGSDRGGEGGREGLHSCTCLRLEAQSQHFRQADSNLANPRASAWFRQ
eukprot:1159112-Pelagomonas_calceolata.AAC.5